MKGRLAEMKLKVNSQFKLLDLSEKNSEIILTRGKYIEIRKHIQHKYNGHNPGLKYEVKKVMIIEEDVIALDQYYRRIFLKSE